MSLWGDKSGRQERCLCHFTPSDRGFGQVEMPFRDAATLCVCVEKMNATLRAWAYFISAEARLLTRCDVTGR